MQLCLSLWWWLQATGRGAIVDLLERHEEMAMASTIDPREAEHFGSLAADWWNPDGSSAMLHKLGPVRLSWIRARIDEHFGSDHAGFRPLEGRSAIDVGCGAGLLCEPLARLGAKVTGVDAAQENIAAARTHAEDMALDIDYRSGEFQELGLGQYDLVTSLEVIEHVADPGTFLSGLCGLLAPGGLMILSTPNRTAASRLLLVEAAERLGQVPRGTHHWDQFITPDELEAMAGEVGLEVIDRSGISFSPARGLTLSDNMALNYLMAFRSAES